MKKINYLFITCLCLCLNYSTNAQSFDKPYKGAVGLRFGYWSTLNLSGKFFINDNSAIELNLGTRSYFSARYVEVVGLYERYNSVSDVEGLNWYYGGGLSLGTYTDIDDATLLVGLAGLAGIEYKFKDTPIAISLDWMPTFFISNSYFTSSFAANRGGLAVRYTF